MERETLRELAQRAGGEYIRRRGRYALVRWDLDTVRMESQQSLEQAADEVEAIIQHYENIRTSARVG